MSIVRKARTALNKLLDKAIDAATPSNPVKIRPRIEQDENLVYAVITVGEHEVRERLPVDIFKWDVEKQSDYLDYVKQRLYDKLNMERKDEPPPRKANRKERRASGITSAVPPSRRLPSRRRKGDAA